MRDHHGHAGLGWWLVIQLAGCGGAPAASEPPVSPSMVPAPSEAAPGDLSTSSPSDAAVALGSVRLDEFSCTLDDMPEALDAGGYVLRAINATPDRAAFDVFRIGPEGSVEGLVEHIDGERRRAEAGEAFAGPPPWADHVVGSNIIAVGATEDLHLTLDDGTYAIVCLWNFVETPDPVRPFAVAGPIEVGEAAAALCRTTEPACLGPLEAGSHRALEIDVPFGYEVGEGWASVHEDRGVLLIDRLSDVPPNGDSDAPTAPFEPGGYILVAIDPQIAAQDPCGHAPELGVGTSVDALAAWLTAHEGLEATDPVELSIGGRRAVSLDIAQAPDWTPVCSEGVSLFVHALTDGFWWWLDDRTAERIVLVELDDDRVALVLFDALHAEFNDAVEAAMPAIESIRFGN